MNKIEDLKAIQILDSRNKKALEVSVFSSGKVGIFKVPSGASTGIHEALEIRDSDGGLNTAISNIENKIKNQLLGLDVLNQKNLDQVLIELDNTQNKSNLGGNSMIGVSIANLKLGASLSDIPTYQYIKNINNLENKKTIPYLYLNLINGGKHANNNLAFQEYHIVPITNDPKEAIDIGLTVTRSLKSMLNVKFDVVPLGDEGGFAPPLNFIREPLFLLKHAIEENKLENKVRIALDVAASSFYQDGYYLVDGVKLNSNQLLKLYEELILEFKIYSIEDPFHEEDFDSFRILKNKYHNLIVVGDDLTVTNQERLKQAILHDSINALIIKPNQIGTISETFETINLALKNDIKIIVSHRSGETLDDFIADLAYAYNAFGLKSGAPTKPERLVKYNRLINIIKENE